MGRKQCILKHLVQPSRGLVDEKFIILVQKAPPGFQLTVHALHKCDDGHRWEAFGRYTADTKGTVNVSEDPSLGGTYSGVEQMGVLWSLRPVPGKQTWAQLRKMNVQIPMQVIISVYQGHQTDGFIHQVPLASVAVERCYMASSVSRISITEDGLSATLFLPPGPGPFPGLLDLWGGGGQLVECRASLLASHGIATLALDCPTAKITKQTGKMVDLQYFELWCAVCISGSHAQPVNGSVEEMLQYLRKNSDGARFSEENALISRHMLPIPTEPTLKVDMKEMMEHAGNSDLLTVLSYPNAGHLIEPPHAARQSRFLQKFGNTREDDGSVGRRDSGTFSRSGRRLEETAGLSDGESAQWHKLWCNFIVPPVTKATTKGESIRGSGSKSQ